MAVVPFFVIGGPTRRAADGSPGGGGPATENAGRRRCRSRGQSGAGGRRREISAGLTPPGPAVGRRTTTCWWWGRGAPAASSCTGTCGAHPDLALPEIKESYYYRSLADFRRARRLKDADGKILVDVGNLAYMDAALVPGVARLRRDGYRVLLVVLLRDHRARALSMMRFRRSRGERSAWRGRRGLEEAVVRDRLTPRQLQAMFRLDVDVLTIHFPALIDRPAEILDVLAARCRIARFAEVRRDVANESEDARYFWLAALGKMGAGVLRRLGFRRTWQRLNPGDNRFTRRLFFVPPRGEPQRPQSERERCAMSGDGWSGVPFVYRGPARSASRTACICERPRTRRTGRVPVRLRRGRAAHDPGGIRGPPVPTPCGPCRLQSRLDTPG